MNKPVFEKFDYINDVQLRVFNRTALVFNLTQDFGIETAETYMKEFSEGEKAQILIMTHYIKKHGLDNVRKEVTMNLVLVEDDE